jgi:hypothetical protein
MKRKKVLTEENPKSFSALLDLAVDLEVELRRCNSNKLSAKAFVNEALEQAGLISDADYHRKRWHEVQQLYLQLPPGSGVARFVERVVKSLYGDFNITSPVPRSKFDKTFRVYAERHGISLDSTISVGECLALAALFATEQFPHKFGSDHAKHTERKARAGELTAKLAKLRDSLGKAITLKDVKLAPADDELDRRNGLMVVKFVVMPEISPAMVDWTTALIQRLADLRQQAPVKKVEKQEPVEFVTSKKSEFAEVSPLIGA